MFDAELDAAHAIADRAGEIALSFFRHDPEVRWKPAATPVTDASLPFPVGGGVVELSTMVAL